MEPETVLTVLFLENQLGLALVSLAVDRMSDAFFVALGEKMAGTLPETIERLINKDVEMYSRLYTKLVRQISNLKN